MKFATKYLQGQWSAIRKRLRSSAGNKARSFEKADQILLIGLMLPLMTIVNMTMFGVALPTIRNTFEIRADVTAWLVTAYSLPFMLFMPLYGRLADELGKRQHFSRYIHCHSAIRDSSAAGSREQKFEFNIVELFWSHFFNLTLSTDNNSSLLHCLAFRRFRSFVCFCCFCVDKLVFPDFFDVIVFVLRRFHSMTPFIGR
jgi:DHA2 family metal-tetracycline-proton antiporter-like MFS transporter